MDESCCTYIICTKKVPASPNIACSKCNHLITLSNNFFLAQTQINSLSFRSKSTGRGPHQVTVNIFQPKPCLYYIILSKGELSNIHLYNFQTNGNYWFNHTNKTCFSRSKWISGLKSARERELYKKENKSAYICRGIGSICGGIGSSN